MIFGTGNIIDASTCFGKEAQCMTENTVWYLRGKLMTQEILCPLEMRDLDRGERLLDIVRKRNPRKHRYVTRHGGGDSAA